MEQLATTASSAIAAGVTGVATTVSELVGSELTTAAAAPTDQAPPELVWILAVGFVIAFALAFGVGANDVANSFGTSVGARVLTLRQACVLATVFETAGAVLIGYKVSDTVRKGIFDVSIYRGDERTLMLGCLSALLASAVWNIVATALALPISGTHSIVGAMAGFSVVARGFSSIRWKGLAKIVSSWFVSPVLSGALSAGIFYVIVGSIIRRSNPLRNGLVSLPFFYFGTLFINFCGVFLDGPQVLRFDRIPPWAAFAISGLLALAAALVVWFFLVPRLKTAIEARRPPVKGMFSVAHAASATVNGGGPQAQQQQQLCESSNLRGQLVAGSVADSAAPGVTCVSHVTPECHVNIAFEQTEPSATVAAAATREKRTSFVRASLRRCRRQLQSNGACSASAPCSPQCFAVANAAVNVIPASSEDDDSAANGAAGRHASYHEVNRLFSFLQVLTAVFGSFAHGGNDVSNAIGPLVSLWLIYFEGSVAQKAETPIWLLLYGGVGICVGLWIYGQKVIRTIGEKLTKISPADGFSIEIGAATTVLLASKVGLPVSSTHCKVGSVVFVGFVNRLTGAAAKPDASASAAAATDGAGGRAQTDVNTAGGGVNWGLFKGIVAAWAFTLPITAGLSALIMYILMALL